jgi:hypothetical protein
VRCFQENIRLFAPAATQTEKYNLYMGLTVIAEALNEIQNCLTIIESNQRP